MHWVFILLTFTCAVLSTPSYNPKRVVNLPLEIAPDGSHIVELYVGTPPELGRYLLSFQSDYSGTWTRDLMNSRSFCDDCKPYTRDKFYIGPYKYYFEIRSIPNEINNAMRLGKDIPYYPPMQHESVTGWLGLGPMSEIWKVWDAFTIDRYTLTLTKHPLVKSKRQSYLTEFDRQYPNVPLKLNRHTRWWHLGWLASTPSDEDTVITPMKIKTPPSVDRIIARDKAWLAAHHASNLVFILFNNKTNTDLSQPLFDSLFFKSNVYNLKTIPRKICLAPMLYMKQKDWFRHDPMSGQNKITVGFIARPDAMAMLNQHPIQDVSAQDLVSLSLHTILKGNRVKMAPDSGEIAFISMMVNDHISTGYLYLLIVLFILIMIIDSVRMVYLHPVVIRKGLAVRFNVRSHLEIGFRSKGFWLIQIFQVLSVTCVLIALWTSDKMEWMRTNTDRVDSQVIYWITVIFVDVTVFLEVVNILLLTFVSFKDVEQQEVQKIRARVFVITHGFHIQTLFMAVWIVLMDRTSTDITNLAASLFSMIMVAFAVMSPLALLDRLLHPTSSEYSQLWQTPGTNTANPNKHHPQAWSYAYAVFAIVWMILWAGWIVYFAAVLQVYEEAKLSMPAMSDTSILILSMTIIISSVGFGVVLADIAARLSHIADIDQQSDTEK
jgi:hypothetical protein